MIKVLFVDDYPIRHAFFEKKFSDTTKFDVTQTTLVETALNLIENETWDVVYLDHDMTDKEAGNLIKDVYGTVHLNGQTISRFIKALPEDKLANVKEVVIHSYNATGAKRMLEDIESVGIKVSYIPFDPFNIPEPTNS